MFVIKATSGGDKAYLRLQSPRLEGALSGALHDACVPFPKTSGARFSHVGILVTFSQPLNAKGLNLKHQNTTPRYKYCVCFIHYSDTYYYGIGLCLHLAVVTLET